MTPSTLPSPSLSAASTFALSGTILPRRQPPSAVTINFAPLSASRSLMDSALNPPKITECTAPSRAHASMATAASGAKGI